MRTLFIATALAAVSTTAALAMDKTEVSDYLLDMGYVSVNVVEASDTVTFLADGPGADRTIVYNAQTGEILSDTALELTQVEDVVRPFLPSLPVDVDEASETVYDTDGEDSDLGVSINEAAGIDPDDL
ncbi:MAG: hypothetical protein AAFR93_01180 [Pseudomonadota bacterium]